jgi:hypothetical protein
VAGRKEHGLNLITKPPVRKANSVADAAPWFKNRGRFLPGDDREGGRGKGHRTNSSGVDRLVDDVI